MRDEWWMINDKRILYSLDHDEIIVSRWMMKWNDILLWFAMRWLSMRFTENEWFKLLRRWMIQIIDDEWFKLSMRFIEWLWFSTWLLKTNDEDYPCDFWRWMIQFIED
jgi:hypothetical protein